MKTGATLLLGYPNTSVLSASLANTKLDEEEPCSRRSHEYPMGLGPTTENENARRSQECERGTRGRVRYVGSATYGLFSREYQRGARGRVRYRLYGIVISRGLKSARRFRDKTPGGSARFAR